MEQDWKDYFSFTKKERRGIVVLVLLIGISLAVPYLLPEDRVDEKEILGAVREMQEEMDKMVDTGGNWREDYYGRNLHDGDRGKKPVYSHNEPQQPVTLFPFDPNTLDSAGWLKLGVHHRSIRTIQNYIRKGGRFRKREDLERIYGFKKEDYERLLPYIKIPVSEKYIAREKPQKPAPIIIDINTADTSAFIALPGIGSKLANRIITFREKLGGFYSIDQIAETYGLPDSTFQLIKPRLQCAPGIIRKININTAEVNTLKQHPYIKWPIANAIVQFRQQHGPYKSLEDLKQIAIMPPELYDKITAYISIE